MKTYDKQTVDKAIDYFLCTEWDSFAEDQKIKMVEEWEGEGGLFEILYDKGYTDDEAVTASENMDFEDIAEYFYYHRWFPVRKAELIKIWNDEVGADLPLVTSTTIPKKINALQNPGSPW
jgi:hypothetical protein